MDVLKDKSYLRHEYLCRYDTFPYYYHTIDQKYIYGITKQLNNTTSYIEHEVTNMDTLDILALKYYSSPDLYWVIADFNRIQDPYIKLSKKFKVIKIPSLGDIEWDDQER